MRIINNIRGVRFNWNEEAYNINNDIDLSKDEVGVIAGNRKIFAGSYKTRIKS